MATSKHPPQVKLTPFRTFTNDQGRTFAVRIVPRDARHGLRNVSLNNGPTLVEFYDATFADDGDGPYSDTRGFGPLGQFVTSYVVSTLLGTDGYGSGTGGIELQGGVPVWVIDADTMAQIRAWLTDYADPTDPALVKGDE